MFLVVTGMCLQVAGEGVCAERFLAVTYSVGLSQELADDVAVFQSTPTRQSMSFGLEFWNIAAVRSPKVVVGVPNASE
ncbi:hypothetical protein JCM9803A_00460 [Rhodococcus erythropolis]